ncbi:MAG: DUF342 domain-containing protein [Desulfobulbaceae bacterium]|nr:DUF342 domain-containing protein [Desulfobulbaceae bacterium]
MNEAFTTHFQTQTITITVDNVSSEIATSELVRQNQVLLSLVSSDTNPSAILVAGKNCCLSDDKDTVTAEVSGYPLLSLNKNKKEIVASVEITPVIDIADDKMLATLTLYPSLSGTATLALSDILALCKEREISCGIDELTIQETIGDVEQLRQPQHEIPIARGLLAVDGCDAFLRFEVEIGPLPGKILQDGSIDWRERKIFIGIDKDELIATKVPHTPGTAGVDVHSLAISPKPGRDINVKVTGDVQYIEESRQVLATCSGVLSIVNETGIKVSAKQTIDGDVDLSVGNIESNDGLEIKGDVKPGFTVMCKGDLAIGGNIHGATVKAKGNSKITSGLIGEHSALITGGGVEISFVERGSITSGGTVVITKGAYYANVSSKKMIMSRADAKIVGGMFCSGLDFIGGIIGSDNATPTTIAAGVDAGRFHQRDKLRTSIRDQEHELENLIHMHGHKYSEATVYKNKKAALQKRVSNLKKLNLIPDSPLYSRHDPTYDYCSAIVAIQGRIVSGTKIRIGNTRTTLTEDATAIRFYIDRLTGHIVATPYTEGKK